MEKPAMGGDGRACLRSLQSPPLKISSEGRANIDRDVISTNGLALGQTSSSTVSLGHYQSDWMLKCSVKSPDTAMKPPKPYRGVF